MVHFTRKAKLASASAKLQISFQIKKDTHYTILIISLL
nr:MAG TPA: hypothetical protein [Caudoviricetes sp.]